MQEFLYGSGCLICRVVLILFAVSLTGWVLYHVYLIKKVISARK